MHRKAKVPEIVFVNHHLAHAVSAYFHSTLTDALVLAIDGSGEIDTTTWWEARNRKLKLLHAVRTLIRSGGFTQRSPNTSGSRRTTANTK